MNKKTNHLLARIGLVIFGVWLVLMLAGCNIEHLDDSVEPGDQAVAEKMCASLGGLQRFTVTRSAKRGQPVSSINRWAWCNDGSFVARKEKP